MLTWREIWTYIRIVLHWWWVLVLATILSSIVALFITVRQPRYYVATTTLMVGNTMNAATPDAQMMGLSAALANFYAEMAKREPILGPVTERLGLNFSWQAIPQGMLSITVNSRASLLDLSITDSNPVRAAAIANAIAEDLVRYSPNSPEKVAAQHALLQEQVSEAQSNLSQIDQNLEQARSEQAQVVGAADLREVRNRLAELQQSRESAQEAYNQLVRLQSSSVANSIAVLEPAAVPSYPLPSKRNLTIAMAGGGGLVIGLVAIFLLDLLDMSWRNKGDVTARLRLPFLGTVPGDQPLINVLPGEGTVREQAVRETHAQIVLAAIKGGVKQLLLSSPEPSQARSALAVDLAQLFTRSGYRVLLVDADMDEAHLTRLIGLPEDVARPVVMGKNGDMEVWSGLQGTPLKNVMLLARYLGPDGKLTTPSLPWPELVDSLSRVADVVIFDGPSTMRGIDAALLAPLVDGVVLTLDPSRDSRQIVQQSKARLTRQREDSLLGAVVLTQDVHHQEVRRFPLIPQQIPQLIPQRLIRSDTSRSSTDKVAAIPPAAEPQRRVIITAYQEAHEEVIDGEPMTDHPQSLPPHEIQ